MLNGKTLLVGDNHAKPDNLDRQSKLQAKIVELSATHNIENVLWLGDLQDTKELVRGKVLNSLYDFFWNTSGHAVSIADLNHYILVGNHDWFSKECKDHSLRVLESLPNVTIIDEPTYDSDEPSVLLLPYYEDQNYLCSVIEEAPANITVFGHLELKDFDFGNGQFCEHGLTYEDFVKFKAVYTGHFHKYQQRGNVTYLGTPFSLNFGETNQDKFLAIWEKSTGSFELIPTDFEKHMTYKIDCDNPTLPNWREGDFNRFILEGSQAAINVFDRSQLPKNAKILTNPSDSKVIEVVLDENETNAHQFERWASEIKKLDAETLALGKEILGKCNV